MLCWHRMVLVVAKWLMATALATTAIIVRLAQLGTRSGRPSHQVAS